MSFLSLSRGDPAALELLQRAVRARYGLRPMPVDSIRFSLVGQVKGPLGLPVQVLSTVSYAGLNRWRWDEARKLLGIFTLGTFSASFDDQAYYERRGKDLTRHDDAQFVGGARCVLWAHLSFLLTPLTMEGVTLKSVDDTTFQAIRDKAPQEVATIRLEGDDQISVETDCFHPFARQVLKWEIIGQGGLQTLDGFTIPNKIVYLWN